MVGLICVQGGREFTAQCNEMDAEVWELVDSGVIAVLAGAARPGSDYAGASSRAQRHYETLGATVVVVPDPRDDIDAALAVLDDDIALLVLPGGSPADLRAVLSGRIEDRVVALHANGAAISGASAGAMVLCELMVRPGPTTDVVQGLGLVEGVALPHWSAGSDRGWPIPDGVVVWGLPECGGVVLHDGSVRAIGQGEPARRDDSGWQPLQRGPDGGR